MITNHYNGVRNYFTKFTKSVTVMNCYNRGQTVRMKVEIANTDRKNRYSDGPQNCDDGRNISMISDTCLHEG